MGSAAGASRDEWREWYAIVGIEHLLPVACERAEISPKSALANRGEVVGPLKLPSRYDGDGRIVGVPRWTEFRATLDDGRQWARDGRLGIFLQTRSLVAIDIDVEDAGLVNEFTASLLAELPLVPPVRWRENSPRRLLLVRPSQPLTGKLVFRSDAGIIEVLGSGFGCVVAGTHPSGSRYKWEGLSAEALEEVELAALLSAISAAAELCGFAPAPAAGAGRGVQGDVRDSVGEYILAHRREMVRGSKPGALFIRCPWSDRHSKDSGPSETSWIYGGGFKCMHASCSERTSEEFMRAIGFTTAGLPVVEGDVSSPPPQSLGLQLGSRGEVVKNLPNLVRAMEAIAPSVVDFFYDEFTTQILVADSGGCSQAPPGTRLFRDTDFTAISLALSDAGLPEWSTERIREAVRYVADRRRRDTLKEWLRGQVWDGVPRIESFLEEFAGTSPTIASRRMSRFFWTGLAARALGVETKVDASLVMVGPQGAGKSSLVRSIAPWPAAAGVLSFERKDEDNVRIGMGRVILELEELRGLRGRDLESVKGFMTRTSDSYVPKFLEFARTVVRRWVVVGTTNEERFLGDPTGNRRWLPVRVDVTSANACVRGAERLREEEGLLGQLFAEAVSAYLSDGVAWRGLSIDEIERARESAIVYTPAEALVDFLDDVLSSVDEVSSADLHSRIKGSYGTASPAAIGEAMRALGFDRRNVRRGKAVVKVWRRLNPLNNSAEGGEKGGSGEDVPF